MKRRTKQEWADIFALQEASDLDQRSFCEREGVSYHAFRSARRRRDGQIGSQSRSVARRSSQQQGMVIAEMCGPAGFLPVELMSEPTSESSPPKPEGPDLTVELPYGVTLRFHGLGR